MVPLADGRRRLRRRRLPRRRAAVRDARGRRGADRARPTSAGLRVLLDIVPNHTLRPARLVRRGAGGRAGLAGAGPLRVPARARAPTARSRPNDWQSVFGGPAWERVTEADGSPGEWYLHLFAPEQPDLNWEHPEVRADFEKTLRFWFDRGVDGFRIDVAHSLVKQDGLPDAEDLEWPRQPVEVDGELRRAPWRPHPFWDRDEVHEIYREWRRIADSYDPTRGCSWPRPGSTSPSGWRATCAPTSCTPPSTSPTCRRPWDAGYLRHVIDRDARGARRRRRAGHLGAVQPRRRPARLPLRPRADRPRQQPDAAARPAGRPRAGPAPGPRGGAAARSGCPAAPTSTRARSSACPRSRTCPRTRCRTRPGSAPGTPTAAATAAGSRCRGRARAAVRLQPGGRDAQPWLPQPADWARAHRRGADRRPGLDARALPRGAAAAARRRPALGDGTLTWLDLPDGVLGFTRESGLVCVVNVRASAVALPDGLRRAAEPATPSSTAGCPRRPRPGCTSRRRNSSHSRPTNRARCGDRHPRHAWSRSPGWPGSCESGRLRAFSRGVRARHPRVVNVCEPRPDVSLRPEHAAPDRAPSLHGRAPVRALRCRVAVAATGLAVASGIALQSAGAGESASAALAAHQCSTRHRDSAPSGSPASTSPAAPVRRRAPGRHPVDVQKGVRRTSRPAPPRPRT